VGIFGVAAYNVAQRTTEFGVRLALAAPRTSRSSARPRGIVIGLAFDSFLGAILAHWMQSAFAARSLFAAAALLPLSLLSPACCKHATPSARPTAEALRYE
jgi:hypothetical protein